jgi:protein gp37
VSDNSHIEWTDASWNPIRAKRKDGAPNMAGGGWACQRVSAGCVNCYAATINKRLGTGFDYDAKGIAGSDIYLDEAVLTQPLRWKRPRKVFVCSMTDLFGEWVPFEVIDRVFAVMALSPQHTYQVLTKRPERMREYLANAEARHRIYRQASTIFRGPDSHPGMRYILSAHDDYWPLPNVWLGTSVEDQAAADVRIPELLATPAAVRFLSCEPLLGAVTLPAHYANRPKVEPQVRIGFPYPPSGSVDWVIVGGESGPGARPMELAWARALVKQCQAAGVAVFVKQLGSKPVTWNFVGPGGDPNKPGTFPVKDRKGGDMAEWPADLWVREFPNG